MGKNRQKAYHIDNYLNVNGLNISIEREGSVDKKQKQNKNNKKNMAQLYSIYRKFILNITI